MKEGLGKIEIKPSHKGRFTKHCGGKVTEECIEKGLGSPNESVRKQAQFAKNVRSFKH